MNREKAKKLLQEDINFLQNLSVEEYTLYKKGEYLNSDSMLKGYRNNKHHINKIKRKIGTPENQKDYEKLNIEVIPVDDNETEFIGKILRMFTSTMNGVKPPGRVRKLIVANKTNIKHPFFDVEIPQYKYLGVICISSDFRFISNRDKIIGWNKLDEEIKNQKLKHTCIGSSIVPTQPLGYNYLGGKLITLMTCSDMSEDFWNKTYGDELTGITTTSLYGGYSQYNSLKYGKKCKSSEGSGSLVEPSKVVYDKLRNWIKKHHPEYYPNNEDKKVCVSHFKSKIFNCFHKELGIKIPTTGYRRGVYWCPLHINTHEFLRDEHKYIGENKFDNSVKSLNELWKERYAKKRINKLIENDSIFTDKLFYDDLKDLSWEETRNKYIGDVGR